MKHILRLLPALAPVLVLVATPALSAGSEPAPLGADGPWIAIPNGAPVNLGPLSSAAVAALADIDGNPAVTTKKEAAMIAVLMQVLGADPTQVAPRD